MLATGFAEWVAWRLRAQIAHQYVEAVRAWCIDASCMRERAMVDGAPYLIAEWTGARRGPVIAACNNLDEIRRGIASGARGQTSAAAGIAAIAGKRGFLPNPAPYRAWRQTIIERLRRMHPARSGQQGAAIPPEALDPTFDYRRDDARGLVRAFAQRIDVAKNPFLRRRPEVP